MRTKRNGLLIWYNLKGWHDLFIFKNGHDKNKFKKDYKELYDKMLNNKIEWVEFVNCQQNMFDYFKPECEEEFDKKEIKEDKYREDYIIRDKTKIIIDMEKLKYGC